MIKKVRGIFSCGVLALGLPLGSALSQAQAALAESAELDDELKFLHAESFVITASKVLEPIDRSISTVTIITADQIRAMGAKTLLDVLYTVPGVNTTQTGFGGREIAIRGIKTPSSEKVLLLLNGHPLDHNLTNGGSTDLYDNIALDNVQRIEIVRGPGSALYGANAFLGMINILTNTAKDRQGVEVAATGGSFDTQQYNVYAAKQAGDFSATVNANVHVTGGIDGKFENTDVRSNLDENKYDFHLNLDYRDWSFDGHFSRKETGTFAGFADTLLLTDSKRNYDDYFFIVGYKHDITDKLNIDIKAYHDHFDFDNLIDIVPGLYLRTGITNTKTGGEALVSYELFESNKLIFGIKGEKQEQFDVSHTSGSSPNAQTAFSPKFAQDMDRTLFSAYAEDIWDIVPSFRLTAGARYDRYSDFGNTFNPRAGFNWEFLDGYILKFSYGTAFRAPTFGEIGGTSQYLLGSSTIMPEKIRTYEVGLTGNPIRALNTGVTLFHSRIDGIIGWQPVPGRPGETTIGNGGGVTSEGLEFEAKYGYMEGSYLAVNYTLQDNVTLHSDQKLPNVPQHLGNVMLNQQITRHISLFTNLFIKGDTLRESGDNRNGVASYAIVNATLRAKDLWKGLELSASVYNLLDHDYKDPALVYGDFPTPGRSAFVRASYSF
jgi:outer membrane cobalamin receptor